MSTVLITGGTGLIGRYFCKRLQGEGYDVAILSRTRAQEPGIQSFTWD